MNGSRPTKELDVPKRHVARDFSTDWMTVRANGEIVIIHEPGDEGTTAYTLDGTTKNPRVMANADAVLWEGDVGTTHYDGTLLLIQHMFAGVRDRLVIEEWLDESVPLLERTELVQLRGVGGRVEFDCADCGEHVDRERHQMDIPGLTPQRCASCTLSRMGQ